MEPSFVYAGNRSTVLRHMLDLGLKIQHVLPTEGSWLERELSALGLPFTTISSKKQALDMLAALEFDVFVSTGFRHILPIGLLRVAHPKAKFVNIHPSYLPDLRGADPIPGAVLFQRDSGVTCHLMDDGIDTGPVIVREKIAHSPELDSLLLYQLCFKLEPQVFEMALRRDFEPAEQQFPSADGIYYSMQPKDLELSFAESDEEILARIRAFNTPSKGAHFTANGVTYRVFGAKMVGKTAPFDRLASATPDQITAVFGRSISISRENSILILEHLDPAPPSTLMGEKLI
jgi:methionyl-tRNA formyltransferase